ncbi:hypothetical protein E6W39_21835 [Kitasatospora acidiphila]|uniref:Uncharacterized protein n=1 Tax=Kitasatospora acidiphila TaxID=2567942 RepID=A0A540W5S9_9ACTN|nr:hypothetical protein [Kitasatospora acidiphila]TQF04378.1 hypothetical protein E6W39_21835 [Kitasatospora acidiphila]
MASGFLMTAHNPRDPVHPKGPASPASSREEAQLTLPAHPHPAHSPGAGGNVIALRRPGTDATGPASGRSVSGQPGDERARALERLCSGFRTTISPRSAARLADLLGTATAGAVARAA